LRAIVESISENVKLIVIWDNYRVHHAHRVKEFFQAYQSRLSIHFLPPYSPFLNPIEECFAVFKCSLKQNLAEIRRRFDDHLEAQRRQITLTEYRIDLLKEAGNLSLPSITPGKCFAAYNHSLSYIPKCLNYQDITY
jgi:transposase